MPSSVHDQAVLPAAGLQYHYNKREPPLSPSTPRPMACLPRGREGWGADLGYSRSRVQARLPRKAGGCNAKFNRFSELMTRVCAQTKQNEDYGEKLRALKDWATERSRSEVKVVLEEYRAQMLAEAKEYLSNREVLRLIVKLLYPTCPIRSMPQGPQWSSG